MPVHNSVPSGVSKRMKNEFITEQKFIRAGKIYNK